MCSPLLSFLCKTSSKTQSLENEEADLDSGELLNTLGASGLHPDYTQITSMGLDLGSGSFYKLCQ